MPAMAGAGERPSAPVAWIAAGLVLQEIVLRVGGIAQTCMPAPWVTYDARSESRTFESSTRETSSAGIKHAILDVIGAGAVGSHVLECLCPLLTDCDLRIFDPDFVAPENLCLSPLYREEDVGEFKANAAAKRLAARVGGDVRVHPFAMRYEERSSELEPASVRIACVDTFAARKALNDISLRDGVPLVESGSSPLAGQVRAYLPGRTACLAHRILRLDQKAATEIDSASCLRSPAPTLPGVNMVVAGMQVVEAVRTLRPDQTGGPSPGTVMFDGREPERFGVTAVRAPCQHSVFRRKGADTRNAVRR